MKKRERNAGFSLVELIVVIAIMAALVAILAPQYIKYVSKSRSTVCNTNRETIYRSLLYAMADGEADDMGGAYTLLYTGSGEYASQMEGACPSGGTISWNAALGTVSCSEHGPVTYFGSTDSWSVTSMEFADRITLLINQGNLDKVFDGNGMVKLSALNNLNTGALGKIARSAGVDVSVLQQFISANRSIKLVASADKKSAVAAVNKLGDNWTFAYPDGSVIAISQSDYNKYTAANGKPEGNINSVTSNAGQVELGRDQALAQRIADAIAADKAANPSRYK